MISIDWGYLTIMVVYLIAAIAYFAHDGSDPWMAAFLISFLILFGKGLCWLFGTS